MSGMERAGLTKILEVVDAALWAGVLFPEHLPQIVTDLLTRGADTSALRGLAGMDLGPFDPRDARDTLLDVLEEVDTPERPQIERVEAAALAVASAVASGQMSTADSLRRYYRLAVATGYPDHDEVMQLYYLEDEWGGNWGWSSPVS